MSNLAASETCARHSILNFVNVTFVQTLKKLFNMKSRLLVVRSLKKPVPRLQLIDVPFHNSSEISWMSQWKTMKKQHPNACETFNSTEHQESKIKTPRHRMTTIGPWSEESSRAERTANMEGRAQSMESRQLRVSFLGSTCSTSIRRASTSMTTRMACQPDRGKRPFTNQCKPPYDKQCT